MLILVKAVEPPDKSVWKPWYTSSPHPESLLRVDLELASFQRAAGNLAVQHLLRSDQLQLSSSSSPGAEIGLTTRADAEARTGVGLAGVQLHDDLLAHMLTMLLGAHALTLGDHIFLGPTLNTPLGPRREEALSHELVHVAQVRRGWATGRYASSRLVEEEAAQISQGSRVGGVEQGAGPGEAYGLWWVIPIAAGLYVLLRPNVANAPSQEDVAAGRLQPSVSEAQVAGEALALFAVPTGVAGALGRLGFGVVSSFALSGAASSLSYHGVQDVGAGEFSGIEAYVVDATTGLVIGAVVGRVFRPFVNLAGPARPSPSLIHLTDPAGQAGIEASGVLRGSQGIYALPSSAAGEDAALRFFRTLLPLARTRQVVPIPGNAAGLFSRPVPVGQVSLYQRLMGVYRAPAGSINLLTGEFTASGNVLANITGQFWPYGVDAVIWAGAGVAGSMVSPARGGAYERGIFSPLYGTIQGIVRTQPPLVATERSDGPFVFIDLPAGPAELPFVPELPFGPQPRAGGLPAVIFVTPLFERRYLH